MSLKKQIAVVLHQLPSRAHASVFIDALKEVRQKYDQQNVCHATFSEIMSEVVGVLDGWIESINCRYADPTDSHKKGKLDDAIGETCQFLKSFGFYY